jgi:hypothetical protein
MIKYIYDNNENLLLSRSYQRKTPISDKSSLKQKFKPLLESSSNILTPYHRKRLLGEKRKERGGTTESDLWYRIKPRCKTGMMDLLLVSEIANEEILKEIFYTKDERTGSLPIRNLFRTLFPPTVKQITDEEKWRTELLEEIVCNGLEWYLARGVFTTRSHQRLIYETLDAITVMSSGRKIYEQTKEGHYVDRVDYEGIPSYEHNKKQSKRLSKK